MMIEIDLDRSFGGCSSGIGQGVSSFGQCVTDDKYKHSKYIITSGSLCMRTAACARLFSRGLDAAMFQPLKFHGVLEY